MDPGLEWSGSWSEQGMIFPSLIFFIYYPFTPHIHIENRLCIKLVLKTMYKVAKILTLKYLDSK